MDAQLRDSENKKRKKKEVEEISVSLPKKMKNDIWSYIRDIFVKVFVKDKSLKNLGTFNLSEDAKISHGPGKDSGSIVKYNEVFNSRQIISSINTILDVVVGEVKEEELAKKKIEILRFYDSRIPGISVDSEKLRVVFKSILKNAAEAIEEPGTITITTCCDERKVRVTISDTGKGIKPENIPKIFENNYTTKSKGKGQGLSISFEITESLGGSIDVQSIEGQGSSFTVCFPSREDIWKDY